MYCARRRNVQGDAVVHLDESDKTLHRGSNGQPQDSLPIGSLLSRQLPYLEEEEATVTLPSHS